MTPEQIAARWLADAQRYIYDDKGEQFIDTEHGDWIDYYDATAAIARHLTPGDDLVERAEAALEGVTPGPWLIGNLESYEGDTGIAFRRVYFPTTAEDEVQEAHVRGDNCDANARFIAFARQWVPKAAARLSALTAQVAEAGKMLAEQDHEYNRKTNDMIERHAKHTARLRDRLARMGKTYWMLRSFATHDDGCKLNKPPRFEGPCSCGLAKALTDGESLAALTDGGSNG